MSIHACKGSKEDYKDKESLLEGLLSDHQGTQLGGDEEQINLEGRTLGWRGWKSQCGKTCLMRELS